MSIMGFVTEQDGKTEDSGRNPTGITYQTFGPNKGMQKYFLTLKKISEVSIFLAS